MRLDLAESWPDHHFDPDLDQLSDPWTRQLAALLRHWDSVIAWWYERIGERHARYDGRGGRPSQSLAFYSVSKALAISRPAPAQAARNYPFLKGAVEALAWPEFKQLPQQADLAFLSHNAWNAGSLLDLLDRKLPGEGFNSPRRRILAEAMLDGLDMQTALSLWEQRAAWPRGGVAALGIEARRQMAASARLGLLVPHPEKFSQFLGKDGTATDFPLDDPLHRPDGRPHWQVDSGLPSIGADCHVHRSLFVLTPVEMAVIRGGYDVAGGFIGKANAAGTIEVYRANSGLHPLRIHTCPDLMGNHRVTSVECRFGQLYGAFETCESTDDWCDEVQGWIWNILMQFIDGSRTAGYAAAPASSSPTEPEGALDIHVNYQDVHTDGRFDPASTQVQITSGPLSGSVFSSPSAAAKAVVSLINPGVKPDRNGWTFWKLNDGGQPLDAIRHDTLFWGT